MNQGIFNQTFQLIWLLSLDGRLVEANDAALSFLNVSREQVIGIPFWELPGCRFSPEALQRLKGAIARSAQGECVRYDLDLLGGHHVVSTLDFALKPLPNEAGLITHVMAEGHDITERKTTEAALYQLNEELEARVFLRTAEIQRYAEAIENMQDGFHLWHLEDPSDARSFRLILSNPAAEHLLTIANDYALGKYMPDLLPSVFDTDMPEICRQVLQMGQDRDLDNVDYVLPSGDRRTFSVKLFSLDAEYLGVLFEDVTRQRQIQQELSEQREQLRIIFDQAGVGIARLSLDGQWIQVNEKLAEILGYSHQELLQTDFQTITYAQDTEVSKSHYLALLNGDIDSVSLEKRYVRKTGEPIWCSVTSSLIRDAHQPKYFIAFIEDITERKAAALTLQHQKNELTKINKKLAQVTRKLQAQNQELDQFAYVASHDLKAPLRAIANLSTWIEEDISDLLPPENKQQLDLLRGRVQRMENLINGLLSYSRAGRMDPVPEEVNVRRLVQEIVDLLAPPEAFTITIDPQLPTFSANRVPLTQVFTNLITNAIKHHHRPDGTIQVSHRIAANDEFFEFSVTDDGPGIQPEYHAKIFDIFQVLEARDKVENTGIGLAIVKKMVDAEGGKISVESQPGEGTTFRFTWPRDG
ncbi:MAG: PAS domain S-box protein [Leptolyngbyaceae bacterium]|nr:PAS domain S-box protein [Leptolyngbyaceae bacterium]